MEYATLQNGLKMPMEGFGVFKFVIKRNVAFCAGCDPDRIPPD